MLPYTLSELGTASFSSTADRRLSKAITPSVSSCPYAPVLSVSHEGCADESKLSPKSSMSTPSITAMALNADIVCACLAPVPKVISALVPEEIESLSCHSRSWRRKRAVRRHDNLRGKKQWVWRIDDAQLTLTEGWTRWEHVERMTQAMSKVSHCASILASAWWAYRSALWYKCQSDED